MSAPSSVQFSEADHMDFVAINNITNNMPILDQTVQDPINKESEEFMSILNDLQKDCNQDFGNNQQQQQPQQQQQQLGPVHHQQQQPPQQPSNAQIMDGLLKEQENQEFFDNNIDKIDDVMDGNKIVENKLNNMRSAEGGEDFEISLRFMLGSRWLMGIPGVASKIARSRPGWNTDRLDAEIARR